jgi:S1-C subfamily serine protease
MGTDYTTGIKSEVLNADLDASDQVSFIETGIPAVQLFTGATENYHRPSDTWDKIDSKGLVKVATVAKEVVEYLANRTEPLPFTGDKKTHKTSINKNHTEKSKRASTGTIPDFVYAGPGVKINSLIKNSNGEKAGLKNGDIILKVNDDNISDLKNYTSTLDKYKPGDTAEFTILRNGKTIEIKLTFGER